MKTLSGFILTASVVCTVNLYGSMIRYFLAAELIHTAKDCPNTESEGKKYKARVKQRVNKLY